MACCYILAAVAIACLRGRGESRVIANSGRLDVNASKQSRGIAMARSDICEQHTAMSAAVVRGGFVVYG